MRSFHEHEWTANFWGVEQFPQYTEILAIITMLQQEACMQWIRGGADKSLARPTSWCPKTESIVIGKRGLFMCRSASLFLLQRLKGGMSGDARDFNNMETRAVIKFPPPPPARQGTEGNSCHSDRNIVGTCTIVCHRQKLGGPV